MSIACKERYKKDKCLTWLMKLNKGARLMEFIWKTKRNSRFCFRERPLGWICHSSDTWGARDVQVLRQLLAHIGK